MSVTWNHPCVFFFQFLVCFSRWLSNNLFKTYFVYFSVNMGQEAKTAVEAIKIEDTCCKENICLIVMKPKTNFGIKIMMHVRKMF